MLWQLTASYGLCLIIMIGDIFEDVREFLKRWPMFVKFFNCPLCIGFWTGIIISLLFSDLPLDHYSITFPLISAVFCLFADYLRKIIDFKVSS